MASRHGACTWVCASVLAFAVCLHVLAHALPGVRVSETEMALSPSVSASGAWTSDAVVTTEDSAGEVADIDVQSQLLAATGDILLNGDAVASFEECAPTPPDCDPVGGKLQSPDGFWFQCVCDAGYGGASCATRV